MTRPCRSSKKMKTIKEQFFYLSDVLPAQKLEISDAVTGDARSRIVLPEILNQHFVSRQSPIISDIRNRLVVESERPGIAYRRARKGSRAVEKKQHSRMRQDPPADTKLVDDTHTFPHDAPTERAPDFQVH